MSEQPKIQREESFSSAEQTANRVQEYLRYSNGTVENEPEPWMAIIEELKQMSAGDKKIYDAPDGMAVTVEKTEEGFTLLDFIE